MKKCLMIASVASMIDQFNMQNIFLLQRMGYEVTVVANFTFGNTSSQERIDTFREELTNMGVKIYNIHFSRNVFKFSNIEVFKQVKKIIKQETYDIIHCHSPIGGVITRLAARKARKKGTKVIYTAHGFHFFKGAPLVNWLLYYPVEKWLARYTDVLITINNEDYERAKTFKAKKVCYIPGIGVDIHKFVNIEINKETKRAELGVPANATMLLSVGELIKRKNHEIVIRALSKLNNPKLYYVICGKGELNNYLVELCKELKISNNVIFVGFRSDIAEICKTADIFVFPSFQEGLPVALMEAMAAGLPCIASKIRGNIDLIIDGEGGYLIPFWDINEFSKAIKNLTADKNFRDLMGIYNLNKVKQFDIESVKKLMEDIYLSV